MSKSITSGSFLRALLIVLIIGDQDEAAIHIESNALREEVVVTAAGGIDGGTR
jgi:hypothetical protein